MRPGSELRPPRPRQGGQRAARRYGGIFFAGLGLLLAGATPAPAPRPTASRIDLIVEGRVRSVRQMDLDGDGRRDLVVVSVRGHRGAAVRLLSWFRHLAGGSWSRRPDLVWPLPVDIALLDTAKEGAGESLLALSPGSVDRLRLGTEGSIERERVSTVTLPHFQAEPESVGWLDFATAVTGHGLELLLPGPAGSRLILVESGDSVSLPLRPETSFWRSAWSDPRFHADYSYPPVAVADQNGDGRRELLAFRRDRVAVVGLVEGLGGELAIEVGEYPVSILTADEAATLEYRVQARFEDLEGSGRHDLVVFVWKDEGLLEFTGRVMLFRGEADGSFPPRATQILAVGDPVFDYAEIHDLDGDGGVEILVPEARLGILSFVRFVATRRVTFGFHLLDLDQRGDLRALRAGGREMSTRFSEEYQRAVFSFPDVDGDGVRDFVTAREREGLCLFPALMTASKGWSFARRPVACIEDDAFARYDIVDLEDDGRDELVGFRFEGGTSSRVSLYRLGQ